MNKKYEYPKGYRWFYKCYNCNQTWPSEMWDEFMQTEEYKTLFDKGPKFNWCTCGCHLVTTSDIPRMIKEGTWGKKKGRNNER